MKRLTRALSSGRKPKRKDAPPVLTSGNEGTWFNDAADLMTPREENPDPSSPSDLMTPREDQQRDPSSPADLVTPREDENREPPSPSLAQAPSPSVSEPTAAGGVQGGAGLPVEAPPAVSGKLPVEGAESPGRKARAAPSTEVTDLLEVMISQ